MWVNEIKRCYKTLEPIIVHDKLIELYRQYLCIGGMPSCVKEFKKVHNDILLYKSEFIESIISAYIADISKYTLSNSEAIKIESVYNSIPKQLGKEDKKFQYSLIKDKSTKSMYESSIDWLISSNMICPNKLLEKIEKPLKPFESENIFKIYFSNIGTLTFMSNLAY